MAEHTPRTPRIQPQTSSWEMVPRVVFNRHRQMQKTRLLCVKWGEHPAQTRPRLWKLDSSVRDDSGRIGTMLPVP
jgi:hypothetical protein